MQVFSMEVVFSEFLGGSAGSVWAVASVLRGPPTKAQGARHTASVSSAPFTVVPDIGDVVML